MSGEDPVARRFDGTRESADELVQWGGMLHVWTHPVSHALMLSTDEGEWSLMAGDWVLRDAEGLYSRVQVPAAVEAAIRADERALWTKAIIGVAEKWAAEADKRSLGGYTPNDAIGLMHRAADLRALVEEARGGE